MFATFPSQTFQTEETTEKSLQMHRRTVGESETEMFEKENIIAMESFLCHFRRPPFSIATNLKLQENKPKEIN